MAEMRFGVARRDGSPGARYWTIRSSTGRSELYLMGNRTSFVHVSLHEDPAHWHVWVRVNGQARTSDWWQRPPEFARGLTRCVEIPVHPVVADLGPPATRSRVLWHVPSADEGVVVHCDLFLEAAGVALDSWPGKRSMGTELVGRLPMADGTTACVVALERLAVDREIRQPVSQPKEDLLRRIAQLDNPWLTLINHDPNDGHIEIIDAPMEPPPDARPQGDAAR